MGGGGNSTSAPPVLDSEIRIVEKSDRFVLFSCNWMPVSWSMLLGERGSGFFVR